MTLPAAHLPPPHPRPSSFTLRGERNYALSFQVPRSTTRADYARITLSGFSPLSNPSTRTHARTHTRVRTAARSSTGAHSPVHTHFLSHLLQASSEGVPSENQGNLLCCLSELSPQLPRKNQPFVAGVRLCLGAAGSTPSPASEPPWRAGQLVRGAPLRVKSFLFELLFNT